MKPMPRKKIQLPPIPEDKFTEWTSIEKFFTYLTTETVFPQQRQFFEEVEDI